MDFSETTFYENYLTSDFQTNTAVISRHVCLLIKIDGVENRDKAYSNIISKRWMLWPIMHSRRSSSHVACCLSDADCWFMVVWIDSLVYLTTSRTIQITIHAETVLNFCFWNLWICMGYLQSRVRSDKGGRVECWRVTTSSESRFQKRKHEHKVCIEAKFLQATSSNQHWETNVLLSGNRSLAWLFLMSWVTQKTTVHFL